MIRFSLKCGDGHDFEAWFSSGDSFDEQVEAGAIRCPVCGNAAVEKAPMAPAVLRGRREQAPKPVSTSESDGALPANSNQTYAFLKGLREHLRANADDVGKDFAEQARKMHYGEAEERNIYGEATADEAKSLQEEGIPALPLPKLPDDHN